MDHALLLLEEKERVNQRLLNTSTTYCHQVFAQTLSFRNYPFNDLYSLSHDSFTPPNQYITLWKYLIYSTVAKLMLKNEAIDIGIRSELEKVYGSKGLEKSLSKRVSEWTSADFDLKILGFGIGAGGKIGSESNLLPWVSRVDVLENLILNHLDDSIYYIIFDELDEDYSDGVEDFESSSYSQLITGLFKAVQSIKTIFRSKKNNLFPIVFLRDDIYNEIYDSDKTKWSDLKIDLDWNEAKIRNLLAFRLSRAYDPKSPALPFTQAWQSMFSGGVIRFGDRKSRSIGLFDYISIQTHMRPRDFVKYLQLCAERTSQHNLSKVSPRFVKDVNKAFSNYLRSELEDEIHTILPNIKLILSVFSRVRKQTLSVKEFEHIYLNTMKVAEKKPRNVNHILQILFQFSVIGNQPKQVTAKFFKYQNREARFNFGEKIALHRGLFRALQVL